MTDETRDEFEADQAPDELPEGEAPRESDSEEIDPAEAIGEALSELSLDEQLEATRTERDDNFGKWQRSLADLENYRRRVNREMDEARTFQALPLARDLLPGLDNLQRAIQAAEANEAAVDLVAGVRMVLEQVIGVLARHGVEPIPALGEAFDPGVHEAIQQVPSDEHEPMTVIEEVEQGFRIGERVVRPAKVIVTMAPAEAELDGGSEVELEEGEPGRASDEDPVDGDSERSEEN
jgi:molecular chaperone GrpE